MQQDNTETSVMVSLNELVKLEDERVQEERVAHKRVQAEQERARALALARARAEEEARKAAEERKRTEVMRAAVEEEVRLEALRQAEVERARIQAQAAAERELADARQRHEREMLKLDADHSRGRLRSIAWIGLMLTLLAGGASAVVFSQRQAPSDADARVQRLTEEQQKMLAERVSSLDSFHDSLQNKVELLGEVPTDLGAAHERVTQARAGIDPGAINSDDIDAYDKALVDYASEIGRTHRLQKLTALDALHHEMRDKLDAVRHVPKPLKQAADAAQRARDGIDAVDPTGRALAAFDLSIDRLGLALADVKLPTAVGPTRPPAGAATTTNTGCDPKDPLCFDLPGQ